MSLVKKAVDRHQATQAAQKERNRAGTGPSLQNIHSESNGGSTPDESPARLDFLEHSDRSSRTPRRGAQSSRHHPSNHPRRNFQQDDENDVVIPSRDRDSGEREGRTSALRPAPERAASGNESEDPISFIPPVPHQRNSKRPRIPSPISNPDDDADQESPPPKKLVLREDAGDELEDVEFNWVMFGRKYVRIIDLFEPVKEVLTIGYQNYLSRTLTINVSLNRDGEPDEEAMEKERERQLNLLTIYRRLMGYTPRLHGIFRSSIVGGNTDPFQEIASNIEKGSMGTRGTDINHIVNRIWTWIPGNAQTVQPKTSRGFRSPITARLLMPSSEPYSDSRYEAYRTHTASLTGKSVPRFCHDPHPSNPNENTNLFFGRYLRLAAVEILIGPSAVDISPNSMGLKAKSAKGTKKGNAQRLGIHAMTLPLLSYIATLVYFALTDMATWENDPISFPLQKFYYKTIKTLEAAPRTFTEGLLDRWTKFLWPNTPSRDDDDELGDDWAAILGSSAGDYNQEASAPSDTSRPPSRASSRLSAWSRNGPTDDDEGAIEAVGTGDDEQAAEDAQEA